MNRRLTLFLLAGFFVLAGFCAHGAPKTQGATQEKVVVKVAPPSADVAASTDKAAERWSFWVRTIEDSRTDEMVGSRLIGTLDQRYSEDDARVELDRSPTEYISDELKRFFLVRGMEASSRERARVFVDVRVHKFELERDASGLADKTSFLLEYTIYFTPRGSESYTTVRLRKSSWVKRVAPFGSDGIVGGLIAKALGDTFVTLENTDQYKNAAAQ